VPWCEDCARFYNPNTLRVDGTCPTCGRRVADSGGEATATRAPWHFWVLVAAAVAYLLWRLLQGVGWLADSLF
jgi:hypothetical protein